VWKEKPKTAEKKSSTTGREKKGPATRAPPARPRESVVGGDARGNHVFGTSETGRNRRAGDGFRTDGGPRVVIRDALKERGNRKKVGKRKSIGILLGGGGRDKRRGRRGVHETSRKG